MSEDLDPNNFTQKDLMQYLLHAVQHSVTREEMSSQFEQAEKMNQRRFEQVDKRLEQVDKQFDELKLEIKDLGKRHDRLLWAIFAGMLAIFFKDVIVKVLTQI